MRVANTVSHFVRSLFCCTLAYYTRLVVGKDIQTDKKNTHAIVRRSEKTTKLYNIVCVTGTIATTNERHCSNRLQISTAKCFLNLATRSNNNKTYPTFYYSKMSPMPKNMTYFWKKRDISFRLWDNKLFYNDAVPIPSISCHSSDDRETVKLSVFSIGIDKSKLCVPSYMCYVVCGWIPKGTVGLHKHFLLGFSVSVFLSFNERGEYWKKNLIFVIHATLAQGEIKAKLLCLSSKGKIKRMDR